MQTTQFKSIVIDASECAIERPKKTERILQWQKEKTHIDTDNFSRQSSL